MTVDIIRLGPLYGKLGFETPAPTIEARLSGAGKAGTLSVPELLPVLRVTVGLPVSPEALAPFRTAVGDLTFDAVPSAPETRLLAAVAILEALQTNSAGAKLSILAAAAQFGGMRAPPQDASFSTLVEDALARHQATDVSPLAPIPRQPAYAASKAYEPAQQAASQGSLENFSTALSALVSGLSKHASESDERFRSQANRLTARVDALAEQMEMQWWASNGRSHALGEPFASLGPGEAAVRAAVELAGLTRRPSGVFAARALLANVLEPGKRGEKRLKLSDVTTAVSLENRRAWLATGGDAGPLLPTLHAMRLAAEADDAADWVARFRREALLEAGEELSATQWANQLYRELVAARAVD